MTKDPLQEAIEKLKFTVREKTQFLNEQGKQIEKLEQDIKAYALEVGEQLRKRSELEKQLADSQKLVEKLKDAIKGLSELPIDHLDNRADGTPVYGIGDKVITVGDIRKAKAVLAVAAKKPQERSCKSCCHWSEPADLGICRKCVNFSCWRPKKGESHLASAKSQTIDAGSFGNPNEVFDRCLKGTNLSVKITETGSTGTLTIGEKPQERKLKKGE
jgi:hypothetical protein